MGKFKTKPSRKYKVKWLCDHGYMKIIEGEACISPKSLARLGCDMASPEELTYAFMTKNDAQLTSVFERLRVGAAHMHDVHGSNDMVTILYASFSAEESKK